MFIDDLADVTIINIDNQSLRDSCLEKTYHDIVIGALMKKPILENNGRRKWQQQKKLFKEFTEPMIRRKHTYKPSINARVMICKMNM
jgi:hypothetical protein